MKRFLIPLLLLAFQTPAFAGYDEESPGDNGQEQKEENEAQYQRDMAKINAHLQILRTDPQFAGIETVIKYHGITYVVNRLSEQNAMAADAKANLPKAAAAAVALANGLGAKTKGNLHIKVTVREYNSNGTIKQDTIYEIDAGGSAEITSGKDEADDKNHK